MAEPHAYSDELFFGSLVKGYVEYNLRRFVRRGWMAARVDGKLAEAGKSVFMSQLGDCVLWRERFPWHGPFPLLPG